VVIKKSTALIVGGIAQPNLENVEVHLGVWSL
jgi:hypothetical protein